MNSAVPATVTAAQAAADRAKPAQGIQDIESARFTLCASPRPRRPAS